MPFSDTPGSGVFSVYGLQKNASVRVNPVFRSGFHADFSCLPHRPQIPFDRLLLGACINDKNGLVWCIKRYDEDEIVLQGCGDDEYVYTRYGKRDEVFSFSKKLNVCSFL